MVQLSHLYMITGKNIALTVWTFVGKVVKNPPANAGYVRDTGPSLGWEDPLKKGMATHSSILAWRITMDRGAWQARLYSP